MFEENTIRRVRFDYTLLILVVLLTGIGLTMVFSASAVLAQEKFGGSFYFLKRTLLFASIGFLLMGGLMRVPYPFWRRMVYPFLGLSFLLLSLTVFTSLGVGQGLAKRWIDFGPFTFQSSELAKIALLLFLAYSLEKKREKMESFTIGILPHIAVAGILILLVLTGRDLGSAFVMGTLVVLMLYVGGASLKHLALLSLATLPFLYLLIVNEGYRLKRVLTFLNPWEDRLGAGFQIIQSFLAFNEGGFLGKGLGAGQQKLFYLPEAHTDFIFSVLGEELGLVGVGITIFLFFLFCLRGFKLLKKIPDLFGRYLAFGIVLLIGIQSLFNMGVVLGLLPTKGLVLPFIGYGGSSLICTLMAVGILLNISTYQKVEVLTV